MIIITNNIVFLAICQGVVLVHMIGDTLASSFCHCKAQDSSFYSEQAPQSPQILPGKYGGRELEGGENWGQNDRKTKGLAMTWGRARAEQRIVRTSNLGSP